MSYAKIIDGQKLARKIKNKIVKKILEINNNKPDCPNRPNLAIILVGEREDSKLYVSLKEKEAKIVGIDTHLYKLPANIPEADILETIDCLNNDEMIDAILVQLPLPKEFNTDKIIKAINPKKDVDRFHPDNLAVLMSSCGHNEVMPPVHSTVLEILRSVKCDLKDKKICIIANSEIFGKSLAKVLSCAGAKTSIITANDKNLIEQTKQANILITAVGKPKFIKADMIKQDAIIIDIGITKENKKISGDVDFVDVIAKANFVTPVPGGVGPLTIAMLFKNTLELFKNNHK